MARPFKFKRSKKPEKDSATFRLLRVMRGKTNTEIASKTWVSKSTISKWRTRRVRYPSNICMEEVLRACGVEVKWVDKESGEEVE